MGQTMKLIIKDYQAWEKTFDLGKAVVRVGSAPSSDISLEERGIAATHLQFHYLPEDIGCKLLNLGSEVKIIRSKHEEVLLSYARTELQNGDEILLGDYRIRIELPITTKTIQTSSAINASLSFPSTTLYTHTPSTGWLTVKNIGEESPCQFHVSVSGLPADCVKIDPIPLLYSGAQEEVRIQLFHQGLYPQAGLTDLNIRVFAPADYPGEQVLIEQGIYVTPIFEQTLTFVDDQTINDQSPAVAPDLEMIAQSTSTGVLGSPPPNPPEDEEPAREPIADKALTPNPNPEIEKIITEEALEVESTTEPVSKEQDEADTSETKAKPMPKPVIVRDLPEEFWDEDE